MKTKMMRSQSIVIRAMRRAAADKAAVAGFTHKFYKYPARFSPAFVASAIEYFSRPGDTVLDPYMGGGTTIVEAFARQRFAVGCDLNSLAVFVARAKVTTLSDAEADYVLQWGQNVVPTLAYHTVTDELADLICPRRTKNLSLPRARPAKKLIALALLSLKHFPSIAAQDFARAVLLNVLQWALNNRKHAPALSEIRSRITLASQEMLNNLRALEVASRSGSACTLHRPILIHGTAENLPIQKPFVDGTRATLVVTSPPYPGIHLLYHRWQVDGRKETAAPYWIADCYDGKGASYYNFADRDEESSDNYFEESLHTLRSIRKVITDSGTIVQLVAFAKPREQLPRYLANMREAGFEEFHNAPNAARLGQTRRIWRVVPSRAWYAAQKGITNSSREVVLIHRAV